MNMSKTLTIVFLGKKPTHFDDFLISLNGKIKDKKFFDNRFVDYEIKHIFLPIGKNFNFTRLSNLFKRAHPEFQVDIPYGEKMIVVHFGKVPERLLSMVHTEPSIEINFFSISERMKSKRAYRASGRKVFYFKDKKCRTIFVPHHYAA